MSTQESLSTHGIHHITAIASSAAENLAFYTGVLGLRLVKRTVNFDDPHTYHLYYGDETGTPGTLLTFFPWEGVPAGRPGRRDGDRRRVCDSGRGPRLLDPAVASRRYRVHARSPASTRR